MSSRTSPPRPSSRIFRRTRTSLGTSSDVDRVFKILTPYTQAVYVALSPAENVVGRVIIRLEHVPESRARRHLCLIALEHSVPRGGPIRPSDGTFLPDMPTPKFSTIAEARDALLAREIDEAMVDEYLSVASASAHPLLAEYGVTDEVDADVVERWLAVGYAETAIEFIDEGVWDADGMQHVIDDDDHRVSTAATVLGRVASRSEDTMLVSGAILHRAHLDPDDPE